MRRRELVALFGVLGVLWGSSFVAIDVGLPYFPTFTFAALRYYIAGAVVLAYARYSTPAWRPRTRSDWLLVGLTATFVIAGHHAFLYLGQRHVSGAVAAITISLSPVLTALFGVVVLRSRMTAGDGVGFLLGFVGVGLVAQPDPRSLFASDVVGVGLVFVAAAAFALGSVLTRPFDSDLPPRTLQAWAMLLGSTMLLVGGAVRGESLAAIEWTPTAVGSLVYLGVVTGAVAFLIYFELLARIGPAQVNLIGYLEPVSATLISWAFFDQLVDPLTALGFLVIFSGFACIQRRPLAAAVSAGRFGAGDWFPDR